jgi:hypothetical protein
MPNAGVITIRMKAGTAEFFADMEQSKAKIREFGSEFGRAGAAGVSGIQATSGALRVMEGNLNNNIRAAERFLTNIVGIGPALQAIFPVVGGIAFLGILEHLSTKAYEFYTRMRDAGEKASGAFRQMNDGLRLTNDELQLVNDRLDNDIAKLEGRRQNTLAIALDDARIRADKLEESLNRALSTTTKLLNENQSNWFIKLVTGEPGATGDKLIQSIGGYTGEGGFNEEISSRMDKFRDDLGRVNNLKERDAVVTAAQTEVLDEYNKKLKEVHDELIRRFEARVGGPLPMENEESVITGKEGPEVERALVIMRSLQEQRQQTVLEFANASKEATDNALHAANTAAKPGEVYSDEVAKLQAQIHGVGLELQHVGDSPGMSLVAKAIMEADDAVAKINAHLKELHSGPLNAAQARTIELLYATRAQGADQVTWGQKITDTVTKLREEATAQQLLVDAIGKGYAAVRAASVEASVAKELGTRYGTNPEEADRLRGAYQEEYDQKHQIALSDSLEKLRESAAEESAMAAAQARGAAAVREASVVFQIRAQAIREGLNWEQQMALWLEAEAKESNKNAEIAFGINAKTSATKALTAATIQGTAALREQAIQNELLAFAQGIQGGTTAGGKANLNNPLVAGKYAELEAANQLKVVESGTNTLYSTRLENLQQQIKDVQSLVKLGANQADIQLQINKLHDEELKLMVEKNLQMGTLTDGVRAFFLEMQESAVTAGKIIYDAMNSALDKSTGLLAKMITGGKAPKGGWGEAWGKEFEQIGQSAVQSSLKSIAQRGLGDLGKKLGIDLGSLHKADGSEANPFWVIVKNSAGTPGASSGTSGGPPLSGILGSAGSLLGGAIKSAGSGIAGFFSKLFGGGGGGGSGNLIESMSLPGLAGGGDVSAGSAYIVGENHPELFVPSTSGRIVPNVGTSYVYSIDARGAALGVENRIARGIEASHNSAVSNAVQANNERHLRTPQRSGGSR